MKVEVASHKISSSTSGKVGWGGVYRLFAAPNLKTNNNRRTLNKQER
jgi:hypothetical protein